MAQIHEIKSESKTVTLIQMTVSDQSPDLEERLIWADITEVVMTESVR